MNSIAYRVRDGKIIDPYKGREDIEKKCIKAVSHHFKEDPVRALRAARQACELNFKINEDTVNLMRACREEINQSHKNAFLMNYNVQLKTKKPSIFSAV